jgi:hypothetical protein
MKFKLVSPVKLTNPLIKIESQGRKHENEMEFMSRL